MIMWKVAILALLLLGGSIMSVSAERNSRRALLDSSSGSALFYGAVDDYCVETDDYSGSVCYKLETTAQVVVGDVCLEVIQIGQGTALQVTYNVYAATYDFTDASYWWGTNRNNMPQDASGVPLIQDFPEQATQGSSTAMMSIQKQTGEWTQINLLGRYLQCDELPFNEADLYIIAHASVTRKSDGQTFSTFAMGGSVSGFTANYGYIHLPLTCSCTAGAARLAPAKDGGGFGSTFGFGSSGNSMRDSSGSTTTTTDEDLVERFCLKTSDESGIACYTLLGQESVSNPNSHVTDRVDVNVGSLCVEVQEYRSGMGLGLRYVTNTPYTVEATHYWMGDESWDIPMTTEGVPDVYNSESFPQGGVLVIPQSRFEDAFLLGNVLSCSTHPTDHKKVYLTVHANVATDGQLIDHYQDLSLSVYAYGGSIENSAGRYGYLHLTLTCDCPLF